MSFLTIVNNKFQDYLLTEYESTQKSYLFYVFPMIKLLLTIWMIFIINYLLQSYLAYVIIAITFIISSFLLKINKKRFIKLVFVMGFLFPLVISIPVLFTSEGTVVWSFNIFSFEFLITNIGIELSLNFFLRMFANMTVLALFILSTPFNHIIHIFHQLHFPSILVSIITLTYRYFFLFFENLIKILRADDCRRFKKYPFKRRFSHLSTMFSMLLLRSFNHGTKIHYAMIARGYKGDLPDLNYYPKVIHTLFYSLGIALLNVVIWIKFV